MEIGKRIEELRKQKGLNKAALGRLIGVSGAAVGQYEAGTSHPKPEVLLKLNKVLGFDFINEKPVTEDPAILAIERGFNTHEIDRDKAIGHIFRMVAENNAMLKVLTGHVCALMKNQFGLDDAFGEATADQVDKEIAEIYAEVFSKQ